MSEYDLLLEMYNEDLDRLYELQKQVEEGAINYSEYEKYADYMVERYNFIREEYKKILGEYEKEKTANNVPVDNKPKAKWHPDLTQEQIDWLIGEKEIFEPVGQEYEQALRELGLDPSKQPKNKEQINNKPQWHPDLTQEQIDWLIGEKEIYEPVGQEYEQALRELGLDPSKQPKNKEQINNKPQWHPDLTQEQIDWLIGEKEIFEPVGQEYEQALRELGLDPSKQPKNEPAKANSNLNIEPPIKPDQPMMILDKEKGEEGKIKTPKKDLPIRSFWEIYNDTCTEHASNLAIKIHNLAHMKILPSKDSDIATKVLSGVLIPVKAIMKLGAIIPNKIAGTDRKFQAMQERVANLPLEEFEVLVSSADKANETLGYTVKQQYDIDYLDPQFMKQYKVNELYLQAVSGVLKDRRLPKIKDNNARAIDCERRLKELDKVKALRPLTQEEQELYNGLTTAREAHIKYGKQVREEVDLFDEGIKKKSSGFRNIQGWFLGKFNPDNRDENAKMAQLAEQRRKADELGDTHTIASKSNEMSNFAKQQTRIVGIKNNQIDRGKYSIEAPIEMLDRGQENRGRLLLTNVAIIASALDLVNQIKNAKDIQATIDAHNAEIQKANAANSQIPVSGEIPVSEIEGASEAQGALAEQIVEGKFHEQERVDLFVDNGGAVNSTLYKGADIVNHMKSAEVATAVREALANGDSKEALRIAVEYFSRNREFNEGKIQDLLDTGYSYDYTAMNFGATEDMKAITDFFSGSVKYNDVVSGTMVATVNNIKLGVSPLAAIFAGANTIYEATKSKVKNKFKNSIKTGSQGKQGNQSKRENQSKESGEPEL